MLLVLWDWECCDASAERGLVWRLVGGEEGRPLGGRLAPTPRPNRLSGDDRSPRLSERRTPICRGRPAPPVSGPAAGALRSLVARRSPRTRTLERCQVRATQAPVPASGERPRVWKRHKPRAHGTWKTGEIQAGFRLVGHRGVKKKARGKTTAQPGVTPVPETPSASPNSLVSYWIDAGYEELGLFGSPVAR